VVDAVSARVPISALSGRPAVCVLSALVCVLAAGDAAGGASVGNDSGTGPGHVPRALRASEADCGPLPSASSHTQAAAGVLLGPQNFLKHLALRHFRHSRIRGQPCQRLLAVIMLDTAPLLLQSATCAEFAVYRHRTVSGRCHAFRTRRAQTTASSGWCSTSSGSLPRLCSGCWTCRPRSLRPFPVSLPPFCKPCHIVQNKRVCWTAQNTGLLLPEGASFAADHSAVTLGSWQRKATCASGSSWCSILEVP